MKTNPILEDLWQIKDDLAREAGYDNHRFFDNLREWAAGHSQSRSEVLDAVELRRLADSQGLQSAETAVTALNDKPPSPPGKSSAH